MWNADGKPYEFTYDGYGAACQFSSDLIKQGYEPIIEVRFVK